MRLPTAPLWRVIQPQSRVSHSIRTDHCSCPQVTINTLRFGTSKSVDSSRVSKETRSEIRAIKRTNSKAIKTGWEVHNFHLIQEWLLQAPMIGQLSFGTLFKAVEFILSMITLVWSMMSSSTLMAHAWLHAAQTKRSKSSMCVQIDSCSIMMLTTRLWTQFLSIRMVNS